jgi:hypothetical protein
MSLKYNITVVAIVLLVLLACGLISKRQEQEDKEYAAFAHVYAGIELDLLPVEGYEIEGEAYEQVDDEKQSMLVDPDLTPVALSPLVSILQYNITETVVSGNSALGATRNVVDISSLQESISLSPTSQALSPAVKAVTVFLVPLSLYFASSSHSFNILIVITMNNNSTAQQQQLQLRHKYNNNSTLVISNQ